MKLWNVERTTGDAVATTNAVLLLKIDDSVFVFDDGAIGGTGTQTTWIFAVHALILAQQPHQIAVALVFGKLDQVVVVPLRGGHRLVSIIEGRFSKWVIVPFNTGDFAGFATDAGSDVDVFANLFFTTCACARNRS